jgi:hypothetical protein
MKRFTHALSVTSSSLLLLTLTLSSCNTAPTPSANGLEVAGQAGDLQPYLAETGSLSTLAVPARTNVLAVNGRDGCTNLKLNSAATADQLAFAGSAQFGGVDVGSTISGDCAVQAVPMLSAAAISAAPISTTVPPSITGESYALFTGQGAGKTLWVPRVAAAPAGLGLEQLANLSDQPAAVSYSRRGAAEVALQQVGAVTAGGLYLDLKPAETTFFFRDPATRALIAKGTFTVQPGESVAVLLVGGLSKRVVVASTRQATFFSPNPLKMGANQVGRLTFNTHGDLYTPSFRSLDLIIQFGEIDLGDLRAYFFVPRANASSTTPFSESSIGDNVKTTSIVVTPSSAYLKSQTLESDPTVPGSDTADLTAGSTIPFARRVWSIENPSGVLGDNAPVASGVGPTISSAGILKLGTGGPDGNDGHQFIVRVSNRDNPRQYAETLVDVLINFFP